MRTSIFKGHQANHSFDQKIAWNGMAENSGGTFAKGYGVQTSSVSYDDDAISELLYMIEEEKLAGDIYEAFYDLYGVKVFDNIAQSEDKHFDALINQAEKIGIDVDEFVFAPAGEFTNEELQEMYDDLLAAGSESLDAAVAVGVAIEEKDMVDIAEAAALVEGTQLASVYDNLLAGSANHLEAFEGWIA